MRSSGSNLILTKNKENKKAKKKTKEPKTKNKHKDAKKNKAPHDEQCSTTCLYTMSVRLLSGELHQLSVKPDTTILAIKVKLENQLNPPEFHKVSLYVGETELSEGSISEVALREDREVQAVMRPCLDKAVKVILELIEELYIDYAQCPVISPKIAKAASFLTGLQFEDGFQDHVCMAAFTLIELPRRLRIHPRWFGNPPRSQHLPTLIELAMWGCHLLGKYGNDSGEAFLNRFIEDIPRIVTDEVISDIGIHNLDEVLEKAFNTVHNVRVAAQNAVHKIKDRICIPPLVKGCSPVSHL